MLGMVNKSEANTSSKSLYRFWIRKKMQNKQMNSSVNELFLLVFLYSWFSTLVLY